MTAPFSLTAPAVMTVQPGAAGTFQVVNSGSQPLAVHETLGRYTTSALHYPAASGATLTAMGTPWITVSPASFTLKPGQSEAVKISSHVPAGTAGDHYLQIVWTAQPATPGAGNLHLDGAVATTVTIPLAGTAQAVTTAPLPHAVPAVPASGGFSTMLIIVPLVLVLVLAAVLSAWRISRRARQAG